jgi:hypothetical protein
VYIDPDYGSSTPSDPSDPDDPYDTILNAYDGTTGGTLEFIFTAGKTHAWNSRVGDNATVPENRRENIVCRSSIPGTKFNISSTSTVIGEAKRIGLKDAHFVTASGSNKRIADPRYSSSNQGWLCWIADITSEDNGRGQSVTSSSGGGLLAINVQTDDANTNNSTWLSGDMSVYLGCNIRHRTLSANGGERPMRGGGNLQLIHDCWVRTWGKNCLSKAGGNFWYIANNRFDASEGEADWTVAMAHNEAGYSGYAVFERNLLTNPNPDNHNRPIGLSVSGHGSAPQPSRDMVIRNNVIIDGGIYLGTTAVPEDMPTNNIRCYHNTIIKSTFGMQVVGSLWRNITFNNCLIAGPKGDDRHLNIGGGSSITSFAPVFLRNVVLPRTSASEIVVTADGNKTISDFNDYDWASGNKIHEVVLDLRYRPVDLEDAEILVAAESDMAQFAEDYYGNPRSGESWIVGAVGRLPVTHIKRSFGVGLGIGV